MMQNRDRVLIRCWYSRCGGTISAPSGTATQGDVAQTTKGCDPLSISPRAPDVAPPENPPPGRPHRAAFFGLDKTLIPGSSLFLLAQGLHQRDFYGTTDLLRFAWAHFVFKVGSCDTPPQRESSTDAALGFVQGRDRSEIQALAREISGERIVPRVFPDMAELIGRHRESGTLTFVATAGPAELAEIVAEGLGMTGGLGTHAEIDEAERYSGRLAGSVLHGEAKAGAVESHAAEAGIDLGESVAYSESINDLPLLKLVGNAEVVNPDRKLRKVAEEQGWPVHDLRPARSSLSRPPAPHVTHRVAALGLESPVRPEGQIAPRSRGHHFTVDDPDALIRELEATGRFRRDTRMGRMFHRGKISLREVSPTHSLHITLGDDNRVSAHVDRYSPLAPSQPEEGCRYSLARIAAHNVAGIAGDLWRLAPRRRGAQACTALDEPRE